MAAKRGKLTQLLLGVGIVVGLFALLEGGLRLVDVGDETRTSILAYQEVYPPALVPAELPDGTPIWRTWDPRIPFQFVSREKAPNALRVFTFGGSAMAGLGFSPNVTVARQLEELLVRAHPERKVEVVNLGVVAIAAKQVRLLVEDTVARYEPDLVVVYSGNNEFLPVHAEKFQEHSATFASRMSGALEDTNLVRLLRRATSGPPSPADLPDRNFETAEGERLTQARIIEEIDVSEAEIDATLESYANELTAMCEAAAGAGVPILLCSVAVNWQWRGRENTPLDWLKGRSPEEARAELDIELARADLSAYDRWSALHQSAELLESLGGASAAEAAYRAALSADPHMRRATDRHAQAVARVAQSSGAHYLDTIELLAAGEEGARYPIGFGHFYDYVHFTPYGAAAVAEGVFEVMQAIEGLAGERRDTRYDRVKLALVLSQLEHDFLDSRRFLGIGFDPALLTDRDLWKYDKMLLALDERIAANPDDARALAYRGIARSFRQDGARGAAEDMRRALELGLDNPDLAASLARLAATRRVE